MKISGDLIIAVWLVLGALGFFLAGYAVSESRQADVLLDACQIQDFGDVVVTRMNDGRLWISVEPEQ